MVDQSRPDYLESRVSEREDSYDEYLSMLDSCRIPGMTPLTPAQADYMIGFLHVQAYGGAYGMVDSDDASEYQKGYASGQIGMFQLTETFINKFTLGGDYDV